MEQNGTTWIKMEQDGTSTVQTGGTSSKWTSCLQFCCNLWFGWSQLVTFFCHAIRLAELCESARAPGFGISFLAQSDWPESDDYWT